MGIMIIIAPEKMPADPTPAIARPKMKTAELGAAPQMVLPTSKIITHDRKTLGIVHQFWLIICFVPGYQGHI